MTVPPSFSALDLEPIRIWYFTPVKYSKFPFPLSGTSQLLSLVYNKVQRLPRSLSKYLF